MGDLVKLAGGCEGGTCPAVFRKTSGGWVFQGSTVTDPATLAELSLPDHETAVFLPDAIVEQLIKGSSVNVSPEDFGRLFNTFESEAFRLETLDTYTIPEEQDTFRAFLNGEPQPEKHKKGAWVNVIRQNVEAGKRMYRAHIVARPLSDYLRYELSWGYRRNQAAGEEFFILDITDKPNPLEGLTDFWMFDEKTIISLQYNDIGEFLGAEMIPDERAAEYVKYRDIAVSNAHSFQEWWERYA